MRTTHQLEILLLLPQHLENETFVLLHEPLLHNRLGPQLQKRNDASISRGLHESSARRVSLTLHPT